jgi:hypothetical protein
MMHMFRSRLKDRQLQDSEKQILALVSKIPAEMPSLMERIVKQQDAIMGAASGNTTSIMPIDLNQVIEELGTPDVPFVTSDGERALVVLDLQETDSLLFRAVQSGKVAFSPSEHLLDEYPLLRFVFFIHDRTQDPFFAEGFPAITDGNLQAFVQAALTVREIEFVLMAEDSTETATTTMRLSKNDCQQLENVVVRVCTAWLEQRPPSTLHSQAVDRFIREHPM